jgi:beta-glucosidase
MSSRETPKSTPPASLSREDFCQSLLDQMTLSEKVGQMVQADLSWKQDVKQLLREGRIGSLLSIREPAIINEHQHIAVEESRLHIPVLMGNDIIHGYRSIFPIPLALASTWNPKLIEAVARVTTAEALATGTTWNYTPMVDISRDPRWGRIAESGGEDSLLNSVIAQAWVKGIQSYRDADGRAVASCVKHYAAYGASEAGKDYNTTDLSERRLREEYLPPYKAAVDAGVMTLMTSFNDLNGVPATANALLLQQILRKEWGFKGVVVSDYDSIGELINHGFARDHKEAALRSILAGVDIDMMGNAYHFHLAELVEEGKVPLELIDAAVLRILLLKYDLNLFSAPYIDEGKISSAILQPETLALSEKSAAESMVLLKNDFSLLPLKTAGKKVALIGPLAEERQSLLGCWCFAGQAEDVETLHEALQRNLGADSELSVVPGCSINGTETDFSEAVKAALQADVVIFALGESDTMSGEAHSRAHLGLPGSQQALVDAVLTTHKPAIAAVFAGRPLTLTKLAQQVPALLIAWHGGTRTAQAFCDVLLGKVNPSGKLSASFPRSVGQIPVYYAHKSTGRPIESTGTLQFNQAHKSSYLDESNAPLFPFGYGLSYTQFSYTNLQVLTPKVSKDGNLKVSVVLTNTGKTAGTEIVQLYVRDLVGVVTRPVKELKDFKRITLDPGQSVTVEFDLPAAKLTFLDLELHPLLEAGEYKVWIAPNSAAGLEGQFELE